jgi:hypothetical protein
MCFVAHQRRPGMPVDHLFHRATEIYVDYARPAVGVELSRLSHDARLAAGQLHGHGLLVGAVFGIVIDWRVSRIIASLAIISDTTRPAPSRLTSLRNGKSLTPDIGARMTGSPSLIEATEMPIECATILFA